MDGFTWQELIPLRQKNVDQYIPSTQQIIQYAEYIGLQFPQDQHLLYIAKEGITANLPQQWQACQTINGDMVYRNIFTKAIQQEHPLDLLYRNKVFQIKSQSFNRYSNIEFDLNHTPEILPSIQQQKNQLSESYHSDEVEEKTKAVNLKIVAKTKNKKNIVLTDQLQGGYDNSFSNVQKEASGQIKEISLKEKERKGDNRKIKIKELQSELSNFQKEKILKLHLLQQIQSNNQLKTTLIRTKLKSFHNQFLKQKNQKYKFKLQNILIQT